MAKQSVVTPERFAAGFTYKDYIAQINVNKDQFEKWYGTAQLSDEDKEFFSKAVQDPNGVGKILVLGEDWCPDAYRGLPLMVKIAEASGMELRVFPRDENLDIIDEFLNRGEFRSIPTVVFYTKDHRYICHWIERPELATQEQTKIREDIQKEMPNADEQEIRTASRERTQPRFPVWQQETVREIRQLLVEKLGL